MVRARNSHRNRILISYGCDMASRTSDALQSPGGLPGVSVVIPTHNRRDKLRRLLLSLADGHTLPDQIVVVADWCTDGTQAMCRHEFPAVCLVESNSPLRCSGARAKGLTHTEREYIFFLDDDNVVDPACLEELVRIISSNARIGLLGPLMLNWPDGSGVWCAGGELTAVGVRYRTGRNCVPDPDCEGTLEPCDFLPNAFLARREIVAAAAPFDPETFPHNWSEADLGLRVSRAGYEVRVAYRARVWHDSGYRSHTTRLGLYEIEDQACSRLLFRRRYPEASGSWALFWLGWFPLTTVYYLVRFGRALHLAAWSGAYFRGTFRGMWGPLAPPPHLPRG